MDSYSNSAYWGGPSTLDLVPGNFAYTRRTPPQDRSPLLQSEGSYMSSPARSTSSYCSSPSPSPSHYPSTPTTPHSWTSHTQSSPIIQSHGSPLGSSYIQQGGYREYDISSHNPTYSMASNYSSVLCPQYLTSPCQPVHSTSPPKPTFRSGRRGPVVPQNQYSTHFSAGKSPTKIEFRLQGSNELGVPMRLLLDEYAPEIPIKDATGQVFADDIPTTITLRIWWPGYDLYPRRVTMRKSTGLLNRIEMAMTVTECFRNFIDEAKPLPDATSPSDVSWRVGRGAIDVRDLVLLSLYQVSKGSFQADIRLELERR